MQTEKFTFGDLLFEAKYALKPYIELSIENGINEELIHEAINEAVADCLKGTV